MESDVKPVSDEEMLRDFKSALHASLKAGTLGATALVTGLKAIQSMIPPPPPEDPDAGKPFSVIDQLAALPKAEGQRLLRQEITRLREEVAALEEALIATEGG